MDFFILSLQKKKEGTVPALSVPAAVLGAVGGHWEVTGKPETFQADALGLWKASAGKHDLGCSPAGASRPICSLFRTFLKEKCGMINDRG